MITICSTIAFALGMIIVFLFFRFMGIFVFVIGLSLSASSATFVNCTGNAVLISDAGGVGGSVGCPAESSVVASVASWSGFVDGGRSVNLGSVGANVSDGAVYTLASGSGGEMWSVCASVPTWETLDVSESVYEGVMVGFVLATFGWKLRLAKQASSDF